MIVKLLTEHCLEFLSLIGGYRGTSSLHMSKCHIVGISCTGSNTNTYKNLKIF